MMVRQVWGVIALLAFAGCQESSKPIQVSRVLLNGGFELDRNPKAREDIRNSIETFLQSDSSVVFGVEPKAETHRLKVRVEAQTARQSERMDRARRVEVVLAPRGGTGPTYKTFGFGGDSSELTRSVLNGFRESWVRISQQRRVNADDIDGLIKLAHSPEPHLMGFALDCLASRRSAMAVPALSKLLGEESDPDKLLRIIGALAEIGDERAVPALIELTRRQDDYFVLQVVYAVGVIGGRIAEGFLVTLAGGHASEHVRQVASALLKERREPTPATNLDTNASSS